MAPTETNPFVHFGFIEKMADDACNPKFKVLFSLVGKRGFDEITSNEPKSFIVKILNEYKNLGYSNEQINIFHRRIS
mgnify:CR=1 FL=1|tara:strand:+ start:1230 stop:1460 length:231 start_codon:yes stop_codon:yes gene_type:complete